MYQESRRKILLAVLLLGMFFSSLDQTVVGTAMSRIPSAAFEEHPSPVPAHGFLEAMFIALAGLLVSLALGIAGR